MRPPDAPNKGDRLTFEGNEYEVINALVTDSSIEPGVVHLHLVCKQLVTIEVTT